MADLISHTAVLGQTQLVPGVQPVTVSAPDGKCLVAHSYPSTITDSKRDFMVDVTDCTLFTVTHLGRGGVEIPPAMAQELLEQALQAISEVAIWCKAMDQLGDSSAFIRQVGRVDVKFFSIEASDSKLIAWRNPLFSLNREGANFIAGFLSNMVVQNGPSANPIPQITRRVMSSLDLINLGFYTESFVNLFSLMDDLTQEVLKAGLANKGLGNDEQKSLIRAIKEDRLRLYLNHLSKLCGWKSLEQELPALFKRLQTVNNLRNTIMHGSKRLERDEAIVSANTLIEAISWLRSNPFGYDIPVFPLLRLAEVEFMLLEPINQIAEEQDPIAEPPIDDQGGSPEGSGKSV